MRIHWFSPLPPAPTDIAHYTGRVLSQLAARCDVTLWTDQEKWDPRLQDYARIRRYEPGRMCWDDLNRGDIAIYHIGNNPLFHGSIWQVARLHPGLVVLHDFRLHHFFDGLYRVQWRDLDGYLEKMERYYGAAGRQDGAECFRNDANNIDEMAERYPLTPLALENALGVVVHTREAFDSLKREDRCPVAYLPLPFDGASGRTSRAEEPGSKYTVGPPYRLIVFGYLGRNRRLEALLEVLAGLSERACFRLDIYGELLEGKRSLRARIRTLGLRDLVTLHGFVPEAELDRALSASHLAINLRYPTMGEASGSQLRIWSHRLPALVTPTGWYAGLSADSVAFVRPGHETGDLQEHLRAFLADPGRYASKGEAGYQILISEHAPGAYAQAIADFAAQVIGLRALAASSRLAERAGASMRSWMTPALSSSAAQSVAAQIWRLAGEGKDVGNTR